MKVNNVSLGDCITEHVDEHGYGSFIKLAETLGFNKNVIDMKNKNCSNCNECCSIATPILEDEFVKLKKYLQSNKQGKIAMKEAVTRIQKSIKLKRINLMCPFSNSSRKCSIYSMRPQICREFHCDTEIHKNFNKDRFHSAKHKTIKDLFR